MSVEHKYAPQSLNEVIYSSAAVQARINAYANKGLQGNVLLWGPNGTGKSTIARLLPLAIDGLDAVVEEKEISTLIKNNDLHAYFGNATFLARGGANEKLFIVTEELDSVAGDFARFWTALDRFQDRIMLIITTNQPMRVHKSIRSRCDEIAFPALKAHQVLPRAQVILQAEAVNLPDQQVLHYLTQIEHIGNLRAYMKKLDEIIYLHRNNQPLPPAPAATPPAPRRGLKVVKGSRATQPSGSV